MSLSVYIRYLLPENAGSGEFDSPYLTVWRGTITHNLYVMAETAGLRPVWEPGENRRAESLIPVLANGLHNLITEPENYRKLSSGKPGDTYECLLEFISGYLLACVLYSSAVIEICP